MNLAGVPLRRLTPPDEAVARFGFHGFGHSHTLGPNVSFAAETEIVAIDGAGDRACQRNGR